MKKVKAHFDFLNAHVAFLLETYLAMYRGALADEKLSFPAETAFASKTGALGGGNEVSRIMMSLLVYR